MRAVDDVLARARAFIAAARVGESSRTGKSRFRPSVTGGRPATLAMAGRQLVLEDVVYGSPVEKTIWGSPAGKKRLAARLVKLIPAHKVYVEPFAGSGAVFFEKAPAEIEVLGDADPEIAFAFRAIKSLNTAELADLRRRDWVGREKTFRALMEASPRGKVAKLHQFLYLSHFSYGKLRGKSFNPNADGIQARTMDRIDKFGERLKNVTIRSGHYANVVKEFDGKDTFFFLDPPYPGHNVEVGEDVFDETEFRKVLESIKGRFLVTYGTRGKLETKGFHVRKIRTPRSIRAMRGVEGPKTLPQLLITNYAITEKALGSWGLDEVLEVIDVDSAASALPDVVKRRVDALAKDDSAVAAPTTGAPLQMYEPDQPRDDVGRFAETGGSGGLSPSPEYAARLRTELRSAKPVSEMSLVESDLAYRSNDPRTFAMAERMEAAAGRDAMLSGLQAQAKWNVAYATDAKDWLAAQRMGASKSASRTTAAALKEGSLDDAEFKAISVRAQFTQDWVRESYGDEVKVYRGIKGKQANAVKGALAGSGGDEVDLEVHGLSSFTTSQRGARQFAGRSGVVVETTIRASEVFLANELGAKGIVRFSDDRGELVVLSREPTRRVRVVATAKIDAPPTTAVPRVAIIDEDELDAWHRRFQGRAPRSEKRNHPPGEPLEPAETLTPDAGEDCPGDDQLGDELDRASRLSTLLAAALQDITKAQWTRTYINDLPDAAFLYVEPGGEKDDQDKTVPRSSRHFPVRNHLGELDIAHLRNAIARIPQSDAPGLTADDRRDLQARARELLEDAAAEVEKARLIPFQQWGGSAKYARKLAERLPEHKRYVEPFCGAAAVFFAKQKVGEEVLADASPEVVFALKYIQRLDAGAMAALKRYTWKVSRTGFERARQCGPGCDAERFWKHVYGRLCTWGAKPDMSGFASINDGKTYDLEDLWRFHERLEGTRVVRQDWKKTLAEGDDPDTLFFIDPPYAEEWAVGDGIEPEEIAEAVRQLKGAYVIAYTDSAQARRVLAKVGRPFTMRIPEARAAGKWKKRSRLFVASFKVEKSDDLEWLDVPADLDSAPSPLVAATLAKRIPLLKTGEERYVFGVVLEPETVDAQKDIYSASEVRDAAHRFMEEYRNIGLMHRGLVNDAVKILESYVAPTEFEVDGTRIKKGTWLLAVRVQDNELWQQVKTGELGGFSIGGTAIRRSQAS